MVMKQSSLTAVSRRAPFAQTPHAWLKLEGAIVDARRAGTTSLEILSALLAGLGARPPAVVGQLNVTAQMSALCHDLLEETLAASQEALAA